MDEEALLQLVAKLLDVADGIRAVQALVFGADIIAVSIDGNEADAVHEVLEAVEKRLKCIAGDLADVRGKEREAA